MKLGRAFVVSVALAFMALAIVVAPSIISYRRVCQASGLCVVYPADPSFPLVIFALGGTLLFFGTQIQD